MSNFPILVKTPLIFPIPWAPIPKKGCESPGRSGVILKLAEYGIKERTLRWIRYFLTDRKIRVKIDDKYAEFQKQENGSL